MDPVRAPSDPEVPPPFRLGGRVVAVDGDVLVVADAFGTCRVEGRGASIGALVEVHVTGRRDGAWTGEIDVLSGREGPEAERLRRRATLLRARARLFAAVRTFFEERGYLEVETPIAVPSPGLDVHLDAFALSDGRFLITSPEYQMKRLLVGGLPRIFQIVRCFRRGEVGARHNPEFTMLEWYRAFSTVDEMIEETEELVATIVPSLSPPFERLPLATAFARHAGLQEDAALRLAVDDEERFFRLMIERVEPALAEGPPVFLVDWPASMASLARKKPSDPRVAERFELMVRGLELCNGFGELVDPTEQRARFLHDQSERRARGLTVYPIDEKLLAALDEGMPPSSGNALGLDRLVALALSASSIGDVMTFPEGWL